MESLPTEIQEQIHDMACLRQHNNHGSVYGFIIVLDIDFESKIEGEVERALKEYVWDSLDSAHRALDSDNGWVFVSNVLRDQWEDEDESDEEERMASRKNRYQICVKTERRQNCILPLFHYSYTSGHVPIQSSAVLEHFTCPPATVRGIAVSGVDQLILRDEWAECITAVPNIFDRPGKGYMLHPMWTLCEKEFDGAIPRLASVREQSFNFGWPEYPPDDWK